MAKKKTVDVADMTPDQLRDELAKLKKEQFNLRFQKATGQLENTHRIRQVRRTVARVLTLLKHGLTTKQPCTLSVSLKVNDCQVVLQVENPVLPPKPNIDPSGIGMANTRQRLEHSYAGRYQLDVSNNATTYRVELKLNLQP